MNAIQEDTIVAISTAQGRGAIGIVRLSGERSIDIAAAVFIGEGREAVGDFPSHAMRRGKIMINGDFMDEAVLVVMRRPCSYTGEDVVEIHCHGNPLLLERVVGFSTRLGARVAQPGEFTRRAFLNGKMDLSQAEAVADIIACSSERGLLHAARNLAGELGDRIRRIRQGLIGLEAEVEARIDFPEEAIENLPEDMLSPRVQALIAECDRLLESHDEGRIIRDGLRVAIVGKPNAGKSSVFNRLLQWERAIVTPVAGTTRDIIEEALMVGGMALVISDTAGISGEGMDEPAKEGVRRSREAISEADLVLMVADLSRELSAEDGQIAALCAGKKGILVYNKTDLQRRLSMDSPPPAVASWRAVAVSARANEGMDALKEALLEEGRKGCMHGGEETAMLWNIRHCNLIENCRNALGRAHGMLKAGCYDEVLAMELREGLNALYSITGENATDDILDTIFSKFCIGK